MQNKGFGIERTIKLLLLSVVLFGVSCSATASSELVGGSPSGPSGAPTKLNSDPTPKARDTGQEDEILNAVKLFWKAASSGDGDLLTQRIQRVPADFWAANGRSQVVPDEQTKERRTMSNSMGDPVATADFSYERSRSELSSLKLFAKRIHESNAELLRAALIKSNDTEAIVKIDYSTAKIKAEGGWLAQDLLLSRDTEGWKAIMVTNMVELEKYNARFAEPDR